MFVGKARSLHNRGTLERCSIWVGYGLTYKHSRLGLRGFTGRNTLAYWVHSVITVVKRFITLAPGWLYITTPGGKFLKFFYFNTEALAK